MGGGVDGGNPPALSALTNERFATPTTPTTPIPAPALMDQHTQPVQCSLSFPNMVHLYPLHICSLLTVHMLTVRQESVLVDVIGFFVCFGVKRCACDLIPCV
jgi:hypothetical protein